MRALTLLGEFPQVALALTFSFGCALVLAFICLRMVVGLVTREQYNVTDEPRRVRAIVLLDSASLRSSAAVGRSGGATDGPYLLPAAAPHNRFSRIPKSDAAGAGRVVQLPRRAGGRAAESGCGDGGHGAA